MNKFNVHNVILFICSIKKMVKSISSEFDLDEFACLEVFLNELKSCLEIDKIKSSS